MGFAVLLSFLCGISVNKIPHCGIAVISNPAVCVVCVFKPPVYGETKLFAVLRFLVFYVIHPVPQLGQSNRRRARGEYKYIYSP